MNSCAGVARFHQVARVGQVGRFGQCPTACGRAMKTTQALGGLGNAQRGQPDTLQLRARAGCAGLGGSGSGDVGQLGGLGSRRKIRPTLRYTSLCYNITLNTKHNTTALPKPPKPARPPRQSGAFSRRRHRPTLLPKPHKKMHLVPQKLLQWPKRTLIW